MNLVKKIRLAAGMILDFIRDTIRGAMPPYPKPFPPSSIPADLHKMIILCMMFPDFKKAMLEHFEQERERLVEPIEKSLKQIREML